MEQIFTILSRIVHEIFEKKRIVLCYQPLVRKKKGRRKFFQVFAKYPKSAEIPGIIWSKHFEQFDWQIKFRSTTSKRRLSKA